MSARDRYVAVEIAFADTPPPLPDVTNTNMEIARTSGLYCLTMSTISDARIARACRHALRLEADSESSYLATSTHIVRAGSRRICDPPWEISFVRCSQIKSVYRSHFGKRSPRQVPAMDQGVFGAHLLPLPRRLHRYPGNFAAKRNDSNPKLSFTATAAKELLSGR